MSNNDCFPIVIDIVKEHLNEPGAVNLINRRSGRGEVQLVFEKHNSSPLPDGTIRRLINERIQEKKISVDKKIRFLGIGLLVVGIGLQSISYVLQALSNGGG